MEKFTKVGIDEGFVKNVNLLLQFSHVLKRHTQFIGCPLEILRRKEADPAAQIKLPQVALE